MRNMNILDRGLKSSNLRLQPNNPGATELLNICISPLITSWGQGVYVAKKQRIMPWPNTTYALFFCYLNPFTFINYCSKRNMLAFCVISQYSWWRHQMETFSALWPFVRGIHWAPVNSPHKGQWRVALMIFYLRLNKRLSKHWWGWWF